MALFLLDTTTLTHVQYNHPVVTANIAAHASDTIGVSSVNVEEVRGGWLAALRQARTPHAEAQASRHLVDSVVFLAKYSMFSTTDVAIIRYQQLVKMKFNVGRNDLRLAALALEFGATVVTNNARDFGRVPGLSWVDWTK
jgi:tRNA(fMet)-specific endonuclease VapC